MGSVSKEVEFERSFVGLTTRAFCLIPFGGCGGENDFVASVAIGEAMGVARGGEGDGSLLGFFKVEVAALGSSEDLFFEAPPPRVLIMAASLKLSKEKFQNKGNNRKGKI